MELVYSKQYVTLISKLDFINKIAINGLNGAEFKT